MSPLTFLGLFSTSLPRNGERRPVSIPTEVGQPSREGRVGGIGGKTMSVKSWLAILAIGTLEVGMSVYYTLVCLRWL